jgi:hypothetical protein
VKVLMILKSNASLACVSCKSLHNKIDMLKSNASLPCVSCKSLHD